MLPRLQMYVPSKTFKLPGEPAAGYKELDARTSMRDMAIPLLKGPYIVANSYTKVGRMCKRLDLKPSWVTWNNSPHFNFRMRSLQA